MLCLEKVVNFLSHSNVQKKRTKIKVIHTNAFNSTCYNAKSKCSPSQQNVCARLTLRITSTSSMSAFLFWAVLYSAAQISPNQNICVICISQSLFHSHKNNMSFAWPTMLHIKKLMEMHNKETYTRMHSLEISELHCNQLRLATLQAEFVWCLCEVIISFCLFREANSSLQITNYFSPRYRLHGLEVRLHEAASKWLWQEVKVL